MFGTGFNVEWGKPDNGRNDDTKNLTDIGTQRYAGRMLKRGLLCRGLRAHTLNSQGNLAAQSTKAIFK